MTEARTYPNGSMSWVDLEQLDVEATMAFYGGLFGWTFHDATPPEAPVRYVIAQLEGRDVAGISSGSTTGWSTYVAVDDADTAARAVESAGGNVVEAPADAGEGGRSVSCADPSGVPFRLWQPKRRLGAQTVNSPGAWAFSNLRAADLSDLTGFYAQVFGWEFDGQMIRSPGYGAHLAATSDPEIYDRQKAVHAPPGFEDVIAGAAVAAADETPHWHVLFGIGDLDEAAVSVERLGGVVLSRADTHWTKEALVRDPQGAEFTLSQFAPTP